jgi:hypothetical protein
MYIVIHVFYLSIDMSNHLVRETSIEEKPVASNYDIQQRQQEYQPSQHDRQQQQHHQTPSINYNLNLLYDPITPKARKPTKLILSVTEQRSGNPITEFEVLHDKLMHLIIVSEDLSYFAHIHPRLEHNSESFTISHIFPEAGKYKLWVDFKPKGGSQTLIAFMMNVAGNPIHKPIQLVYDSRDTKQSVDGKYQINLKLPQKLVAHNDADIVFRIADIAGNPVTDLEPLMGAGGHSVIISSDIREFLHVHPIEEVDSNWKGGPEVSFRTNFPKSGLYKAWGQFQHQGKIIITDFTLEVA